MSVTKNHFFKYSFVFVYNDDNNTTLKKEPGPYLRP